VCVCVCARARARAHLGMWWEGVFVLFPGSKGLEVREHGMLRELTVEGLKHRVQAGVM